MARRNTGREPEVYSLVRILPDGAHEVAVTRAYAEGAEALHDQEIAHEAAVEAARREERERAALRIGLLTSGLVFAEAWLRPLAGRAPSDATAQASVAKTLAASAAKAAKVTS